MPGKQAAARSSDELWLHCQHRLVAYIAHDLKSALNGASVNLEVVRSRAERPNGDIGQFANAAAKQMGAVISMTVALLSIGRDVRGGVEVSVIAKQLVAMVEDTLRTEGAAVSVAVEGGMAGATAADLSAVRLALAESLLEAVKQKAAIAVKVRATAAPTVEIRTPGPIELPQEVGRALAAAGITFQTDGHGISIVFPRPTEPRTEDA